MGYAAGKMRHKITLQEYVEERSPYGEVTHQWQDLTQVWADIAPQSGREYMASQSLQSQIDTRITIRYRPDVGPENRIKYRGMLYKIHAALPDNGSGLATLNLMCGGVQA